VVETGRPTDSPSHLAKGFATLAAFRGASAAPRPLPFRFMPLDSSRYVATNLVGEHVVVPRNALVDLIEGRIDHRSPYFDDFQARHFLATPTSQVALELLATKYRTKLDSLAQFTSLHLFVVTLRCDHSCPYCQVSRVSEDRRAFDMSPSIADQAIDVMFRSPSRQLKVEFQGGEPLLNFPVIRHIVSCVVDRNRAERRDIQFVIATNLANITDEILTFCREHQILLSTSLDGPADLHNANRPRPGNNSHAKALDGIARAREALGPDAVSAVLTTTRAALSQPERIIDEYVRLGFHSIFMRWLSPYGFAARSQGTIGYAPAEWEQFYARGLHHIVSLNRAGYPLREAYASIVLRKLLTPYSTGFVDLQSPTGLGIAVAAYNYDGDVYLSDEGRMLSESGDKTFRLGNVMTDSYEAMFYSARLQDLVLSTMSEGIPMCSDCAFQPMCGTDPVFHHATQGDMVGHRPTSDFCRRNMFVMKLLVTLLEDNPEAAAVLRTWA
jgi:His-Xaa-Ser system radical SAM maturase HxsB